MSQNSDYEDGPSSDYVSEDENAFHDLDELVDTIDDIDNE